MNKVKIKYQCSKCDRSFDSQHALSGHQVAHTQFAKVISCRYCGNGYRSITAHEAQCYSNPNRVSYQGGLKAKKKSQCKKCDHWFSAKAGNYQKHIAVCDGNYKPSLNGICPHCNKDNIDSKEIANHARWCHKNPKRDEYINGGNLDKARAAITSEARKRANEGVKKAHARGCYDDVTYGTSFLGKKHTNKTKLVLREKRLTHIEQCCGRVTPAYNPKSLGIIEEYGKRHGYNFRHAENHPDGEYRVPTLNYFLDGYDEQKNVVCEFYEHRHTVNQKTIDHDKDREDQIVKHLNCKFIVIYESGKIRVRDVLQYR